MRFVSGYQQRDKLLFFYREGDSLRRWETGAPNVGYFKRTELSKEILRNLLTDSRVKDTVVEGDWLRVEWKAGEWIVDHFVQYREQHCKQLETFGVRSYEADVSALKRYMADHKVEIARPKRVYYDIETDSRCTFQEALEGNARILCWTLYGDDGILSLSLLKAETDEAEAEIIEEFWRAVEPYDQIVFWNSPVEDERAFDKTVTLARSKILGVLPIDHRRYLWLDACSVFRRNNIMSAESGEEKQSFKLDSVAMALFGEGKHDVDASRAFETWRDEPQKLLAYNEQDTKLLARVEEHTGYIELFQTLCEVCGVFPETRSLKPTQQVDAFMLRLGLECGVHFKTKWFGDELPQTKFPGAFVMEPEVNGIEKNVHVADFASLYPSIMISWNLSPDTKIGFGDKASEATCYSPATGLLTDATREGILCTALKRLLALRKEWTKKRAESTPGTPAAKDAERRTNAYKTAANSFYGVCGTPFSRFYDKDISEATTQNGVWLLKQTIEAAKQRNMRVVYGDTDSVFVQNATIQEFGDFVDWSNESLYPALLKAFNCPVNNIKLAYEKAFERVVFTAAKRYIGKWLHYKGKLADANSKPEIKGLEYKRGDASRLARQFQGEVIQLLVAGCENVAEYYVLVEKWKKRVLETELPLEDVVLSKSISQELHAYGDSPPAHVRLAKSARERGEEVKVGSRVYYVVADASVSPMKVIPASEYVGLCDKYYQWESVIYPPSHRLLQAAFPRGDWSFFKNARPSRSYDPRQCDLFGAISQ